MSCYKEMEATITRLIQERDAARAEVETLRKELEALRDGTRLAGEAWVVLDRAIEHIDAALGDEEET